MIEDDVNQLALRAKLATLFVATTGAISLAASATGGDDGASAYIRTSGSFIADGLREGMEVKATGFATVRNNGPATITDVSATVLTVRKPLLDAAEQALIAEAAAGGRTLLVGLPSLVSWENKPFDSQDGRPYVDEQYLPGPVSQATLGPRGYLVAEPMYVLNWYLPIGSGITADSKYINALRVLFAPGTAIALPNGDRLDVRRDVAPIKSQRQFPSTGFAVVTFSIPLRIYTQNSI